eukprot:CAMPEP_0115421288 /NCGR_PEP_ID=MMETSP0271-20121206/26168_1 /TAXON_ID=71861 /ORGANISM="Scrippsiella trochoidea, Strain CCMP3099" /LENGTH=58 /DNA_ID=CAMNT_0002845913 /DNA_START=161 /DNA_END=334 /DNA_ORIENTATION=+
MRTAEGCHTNKPGANEPCGHKRHFFAAVMPRWAQFGFWLQQGVALNASRGARHRKHNK